MSSKKNLLIHLFVLFTVFIAVVLTNFPFTSWYTGWDNLHPEFNFLLNFKRALSAVWQDNQGLGTYGGHGYAVTLPHTTLLWLMSFIIPTQFLRASFTFLMLFTGLIGIFFLTRKVLAHQNEDLKNKAALFSGLFYLLNLATVQQFYIQLESFIVHYAALPWLFYSLISFLRERTRKNLLIFSIVSLITTTQGFIPPLFFVYLLLLSIFLLFYLLIKPSLAKFKICAVVFFITLLINSYWLLPVTYYTITQSSTYLNSYNNLSTTEDFILKNKKYGTIKDIAILKGFMFEAIDATGIQTFPIFATWNKHLSNNFVLYLGYGFFGIMLIGLLTLFWKKENFVGLSISINTIIIFSLLATDSFPFSKISEALQNIPVAKQAFRIAFTKFSISLAFFYSVCFGIGIVALASFIKSVIPSLFKQAAIPFILLITSISMIYFSFPIFTGNLLYQRTKLQIPNNYFQLFQFFNQQDRSGRIANLPQGWNSGWSIYRWGYSGSGFLWYGIEQPIMDRSFDVWGKYNENYYWELSYAVYSQNYRLLDNVLDKYKISWIVFDKNIIPYLNPKEFSYTQDLENYLDASNKLQLVKNIHAENPHVRDIKIYKVIQQSIQKQQSIIPANVIKNIAPLYNFTSYDRAFDEFGQYYTDTDKNPSIYYPFRSLFTGRETGELPFEIDETKSSFQLKAKLPSYIKSFIPQIPIDNNINKNDVSVDINNDFLAINILKNKTTEIYNSNHDPLFLVHNLSDCQKSVPPSPKLNQEILLGDILRFNSVDSQNCYSISLNTLPQRSSYLVQIENRHIKGKGMSFAVINDDSKKADMEVSLNNNNFEKNYIIIPPMKYYGLGYNLYFNNISIGSHATINDIKNVKVFLLPYDFLTKIKYVNPNAIKDINNIVILSQSFDPGWKAYRPNFQFSIFNFQLAEALPFLFGTELKEHVLVNNWENGWVIQDQKSKIKNQNPAMEQFNNGTIVIIFWPQYLEYFGFLLLGLSFLFVLRTKPS